MLEKVFDSCKYVMDNAKDVKINYSKVNLISKEIMINNHNTHWLNNSPFNILDLSISELYMFLLVFQSVDFSYWGTPKWTIKTNEGELDGYYAMLYCLMKEAKENSKFLDPKYLENLLRDDLRRILKGNVEIPLFEERYLNIINVAKSINNNMNGNFYNYVKSINDDINLSNVIINKFSNFNDVSSYRGKPIYFYKLAQLLVTDLLHAKEIKESAIIDCSHLLGCADYKIPQILRSAGILEYSEELSDIVDNKKEILKDSGYENEIRASMIIAINAINKKINNKLYPIQISDFIWSLGQDKSRKVLPYHLTRTIFY